MRGGVLFGAGVADDRWREHPLMPITASIATILLRQTIRFTRRIKGTQYKVDGPVVFTQLIIASS